MTQRLWKHKQRGGNDLEYIQWCFERFIAQINTLEDTLKYWRSNMSVRTKKATKKILEIFVQLNQHIMCNRIKAIMTSLSMSSAGESDEKVQNKHKESLDSKHPVKYFSLNELRTKASSLRDSTSATSAAIKPLWLKWSRPVQKCQLWKIVLQISGGEKNKPTRKKTQPGVIVSDRNPESWGREIK